MNKVIIFLLLLTFCSCSHEVKVFKLNGQSYSNVIIIPKEYYIEIELKNGNSIQVLHRNIENYIIELKKWWGLIMNNLTRELRK